MTTTIYIVRHGEVHNPKGILYGRLPRYRLSAKGRKEIKLTAEFLKDKHIDAIYSSPLLRAKQTAEIIRESTKVPKITPSLYLLEVRTSYQGVTFASLSPDQSELYFNPRVGDETLSDVANRLEKIFKIFMHKHQGEHVVLVSHGDPLMLLRAILSDLPAIFSSVRSGNGFEYIKHGEIVAITLTDKSVTQIKSIFIPYVK